jgi:hypothetical protein
MFNISAVIFECNALPVERQGSNFGSNVLVRQMCFHQSTRVNVWRPFSSAHATKRQFISSTDWNIFNVNIGSEVQVLRSNLNEITDKTVCAKFLHQLHKSICLIYY